MTLINALKNNLSHSNVPFNHWIINNPLSEKAIDEIYSINFPEGKVSDAKDVSEMWAKSKGLEPANLWEFISVLEQFDLCKIIGLETMTLHLHELRSTKSSFQNPGGTKFLTKAWLSSNSEEIEIYGGASSGGSGGDRFDIYAKYADWFIFREKRNWST